MALENKCQVRRIQALFYSPEFKLPFLVNPHMLTRNFLIKKGLWEDGSGWRTWYFSFARRKLSSISLTQAFLNICLWISPSPSKNWHLQWRHISQHKETQKRHGGDWDRPRNEITQYFLFNLNWKTLLQICKSTHSFQVLWHGTVRAFIQNPQAAAAHADFLDESHNSKPVLPCLLPLYNSCSLSKEQTYPVGRDLILRFCIHVTQPHRNLNSTWGLLAPPDM